MAQFDIVIESGRLHNDDDIKPQLVNMILQLLNTKGKRMAFDRDLICRQMLASGTFTG